jgi:phosphoglycerate dehydrogenase-like enzyme
MKTASRILVTPRSITRAGHPALRRFEQAGYEPVFCTRGQQPDEAELLRLVPDCVGWLAGVERVSARVLEAAVRLKAISRNGTGVDSIDLEAAQRRNIAVLRAVGANARGVAELTIGLTLALVRSIPVSDRHLKAAAWERFKGIELNGRTMGLIGCGKIGQYVAEIASGLGMRVAAFDPCPDEAFKSPEGFRYASLDDVLREADVLSLHCPAPPDGEPLIDQRRIDALKDGVYLVNTARGELLDDKAVLAALQNGKVAGLAMDAFREEPPGDDPLVLHERVIATPHVGAFTVESITRAVEVAVENLLGFLQRER